MIHHTAPDAYFSLMIDLAMYTDIRTSTTANRNWQTPYEMTRGVPPFITKMHRPCTRCFVQVPKAKRLRQLAAQGLHNTTNRLALPSPRYLAVLCIGLSRGLGRNRQPQMACLGLPRVLGEVSEKIPGHGRVFSNSRK